MVRCTRYAAAVLMFVLLLPGFASAQGDKPVDVTGDWEMTAETPNGSFTSTLKLERSGDGLTGRTVGRNGQERKLNNVKLTGKTLNFDRDISVNGMDLHLVYTGTVEGDTIKGTFEAGGQTMNWSAHRLAATPRSAPGGSTTPAGVTGTWKITVETPNGTRERTLVLKQEGQKLTGTVTGPMDQVIPIEEASVKGKELRFSVSFNRNGNTVKRTYAATLDGDILKGTVEGGGNTASFTGRRQGAPATPAAAAGIAGTWKLTTESPDRTYRSTVTLIQQDGKWSGKFVTDQGKEEPLKDLTVKDKQLAFTVDIDFNGMPVHLEFTGTVEGNQLKGTMNANGSLLSTTGERAPKA